MNWVVAKRYLRDRRLSLVVYCVAALAFAFLYVALFPSLKDQMGSYEEIFKSFPEGMMEAMGVSNLNIGDFASYFGAEQMSMVWPLLAIIMAISYAGKALSGAVENGTIGVELSQPVSRSQLFVSKYVAGVLALTIFVVVSILGVIPMAGLYDIELEISNWLRLAGVSWLFVIAIYSLAYAASAAFSEKAKVYGAVSALILVMYVARIVASLRENLDWLRNVSFFYFHDGAKVLTEGTVNNVGILVFVMSAIVAFVVGLVWWRGRDVSV